MVGTSIGIRRLAAGIYRRSLVMEESGQQKEKEEVEKRLVVEERRQEVVERKHVVVVEESGLGVAVSIQVVVGTELVGVVSI